MCFYEIMEIIEIIYLDFCVYRVGEPEDGRSGANHE